MRKVGLLTFFSLMLSLSVTGCSTGAGKTENTLSSVEEAVTTEEFISEEVTTKKVEIDAESDTLNGVSKDMVQYYISDDHFNDTSELDFVGMGGGVNGEYYHIKIFEAYASDNIEDFGEAFVAQKSDIEEDMEWLIEEIGCIRENETYLCVPIELTNIGSETSEMCFGNLHMWVRKSDDRLVEYGFADKWIDSISGDTGLHHDFASKGGKSYYMIDIEPGETISGNLLYIADKEALSGEMYMCLNETVIARWSSEYGCELPTTSPLKKYIRVYMREE